MKSEDQSRLVQMATAGDREALGLLWDSLTPKLYGYLLNTIGNKEVAEDLLQSTWLRAIEALPQFHSRGKGFPAWLFAIARNECRQHWRKANREMSLDLEKHDVPGNGDGATEDRIMIDQVLARLPGADQELLRLRYIADLATSDIARVLNLNFVTVRVRLHRALARARAVLISQNYE